MRTVSTNKPLERFIIEKLPNNKCTVLFFDEIKDLNNGLYEFQLYKLNNITYRPTLEKTINKMYNEWLKQAKDLEKPLVKEEMIKENEENLQLLEQLLVMEHRMMLMEVANSTPSKIRMGNYDKSPYIKAKKLIENKRLDYDSLLSILDDFVNNRYMTIEEYSELYDLLDKYYNSL